MEGGREKGLQEQRCVELLAAEKGVSSCWWFQCIGPGDKTIPSRGSPLTKRARDLGLGGLLSALPGPTSPLKGAFILLGWDLSGAQDPPEEWPP